MSNGRVVWFNGALVPENEARISIYDSALMFGDMVFEMTRSFNKKQFKLMDHIDRLYSSARYVHLDIPMSKKEMERNVYETIEANDPCFEADDEHRIMIDVSRGLLSIYQGIAGAHVGPNVIIADFPLRWTVAGMGKLFDEGINGVITSQRAIPSQLLEAKVKSRSRLHYLMANIEASKMKGKNNWAILLDPDGFVAEGTGDNIFIVKGSQVITPEPRNLLRGVSRAYTMDIARQQGYEVIEKNIEYYDLLDADEVFMTGTPFCILPVTSINSASIRDGVMGPITQNLISAWGESVGVDIVAQIKKWDETGGSGHSGASPYRFASPKEDDHDK